MNNTKTMRNANIEALRVIAMFCIVLSHYSVFSAVNPDTLPFGFNKLLLDSVAIGKLGVAVFVMITGYFMVHIKFSISRVMNIILQTLFYSVGIYLIYLVTGGAFGFTDMLGNLFPIITQQYWFATAYVVLSLLMPFLNKLLHQLSQKHFMCLLMVLVFFNAIAPTFLDFDAYGIGGHLFYMIMFYCVGAYIRKYPPCKAKKIGVLLIVISSILLLLSVISIDYLALRIAFFAGKSGKFYQVYSVLILALAVGLMLVFTQMKPRKSKIINAAGACTFGVYLIHENRYMREWIWNGFCNNTAYAASKALILHLLICVVSVYLVCTAIEFVRKYALERGLLKKPYQLMYQLANRIYKAVEENTQKLFVAKALEDKE